MDMANAWADAEFETIFREHFERMVRTCRRSAALSCPARPW
jgi:hypothetical protein